jgi:hypothetical protein
MIPFRCESPQVGLLVDTYLDVMAFAMSDAALGAAQRAAAAW